ncbi:MAG: VTC domain-containing protein, partial [Clostridia bacterium]|nr:VTC domain-containing protein [Clostridia bacterium]
YNDDLSYIRLEKKEKIVKSCLKTVEEISFDFAESLLSPNPDLFSLQSPLQEEIATKIVCEKFKPILFVDYERSAYLHPFGNTRITIDCNVSASRFYKFLDEKSFSHPVLEENEAILEIKYDDAFPKYLLPLFQDIPKIPAAISKFAKCYERLF